MAISPRIETDFGFEDVPDFGFQDVKPSFEQVKQTQSLRTPKPLAKQGPAEFGFEDVEPEAKKTYATPYDVPDLTPEQLRSMPIEERLQYARDLATEREYRQSKGFVKGSLSGATLGLSEKIPGLSPEEGDFLVGFGEFVGSALPITKLYNTLGKPLVDLATKSPVMRQGLESLARMTGMGLAGLTYEGAKETIKTGEVPSAEELAKYGATWALFDGALQAVGKAASFLTRLKDVSSATKIPERQLLNDVIDNLAERNISIESNPEAAIATAEDILSNYPRKMESAREERITRLKAKEAEAEAKITEPLKEKIDKLGEQQKSVVEERKQEVSAIEESFEKKQQALEDKSLMLDLEADEELAKVVKKEEAITSRFEKDKAKKIEVLKKAHDKELAAKEKEINKVIDRIERDLEKRKKEGKSTKGLDEAIEKQRSRLEDFKEKQEAELEKKIGKIEGKELPAKDRAPLDRTVNTLEREIEKKRKQIADQEKQLSQERDQRIEEAKKEAQSKLRALEGKKVKIERKQAESLKDQREKAYAERYPERKVTIGGKKLPAVKTQAVVEPLIETTGEGAAERIEYAKTGIDEAISKMNEYIQAAKTPKESLTRLGESINTNIFNALAPLEKLEGEIPVTKKVSTKIKLAQSAASEINGVLENGIFSNLTGNFEHGGLKQAYGDLTWKRLTKNLKPHEYSLEELDAYRVSKAALKRQAEGKKVGVDTKKAMQDINLLKDKYEPIDNRIREFQKATLSTYGKDLLGNDLIAQWNKDYYAPLYRVMEEGKDAILSSGSLKPKQPFKKMVGSERKIIPPSESDPYNASMLIRNARKNDAILQYRKLVLDKELPGKIKAGKLDPIPALVLDELGIDPEMKKLAETLYNQTRTHAFTPEKNILRGWKDGKPFEIEVPDDIYEVFSTLAPQDYGRIAKFVAATNRLFSRGISMAPRKFGSIFGRDALSSLIYSRTGSNPISIAEALSDIYNARPVYKEFLAMGGDVYASRLAERIDRAKSIEELITPGKEGILVPFEKIGDYFRKYADTLGDISLAVPLGEYKRSLAKYGNTAEGRIMAAMEARRVTYDPTRKGGGKAVRELGNFVPFWNVSLQDLAYVGRNLNNPQAWAKGITALTIPTILLKMANEGNEDYQDLNAVDKAAFWHVYFGDKHIRIPIPWLLGTAFKVGAEAFYETVQDLTNKGDDRAKEAWEGMYENFVENLSGDLPPILSSYMQQATGKTPPSPLGLFLGTESRAPDVVPRRLEGLPAKLQYTSKTSQVARWFGNLWDVSPVMVERLVKNFGGNVASDILAVTDEIAYYTGMAEDKRPEQREANYLLLGHFVSNSPPSRTKYMNEFYDYLRKSEQNKRGQKLIREKGLEESLENLSYRNVPLGKFQREISKNFKAMRAVEDDAEISAKDKKERLDEYQRKINDLYKRAVIRVHEAEQE